MARIDNPVLSRELITHLRSERAFVLHFIFLFALSAVVVAMWESEGAFMLIAAERSRAVYAYFARAQILLVAILSPILSAPAISGERERRSFDLLLTSPLSLRAIITGKLLSSVAYLLLLSISSLPIFSLCLMLGGISPTDVGATYIVLFSVTLVCGVLGVTASTVMGRTHSALAVTYVTILPATLFLLFALDFTGEGSLTSAIFVGVISAGACVVMLLVTEEKLRAGADVRPKAADEEETEEQVGLTLDRRRFPDSLLSPPGTGRPILEKANPIYEKELRFELLGRGTLLLRMLLQINLVAALVFLVIAMAYRSLWIYSFYVLTFLILVTPSFTCNTFTQERERGTFELILSSMLTPGQILGGKILMAFRTVMVLFVFMAGGLALFWLTFLFAARNDYDVTLLNVFGTLVVLVSAGLHVATIGCFLSQIARNTLRSTIYTYVVLGVFYILPVVVHRLMVDFLQPKGIVSASDWDWTAMASPFYALGTLESASSLGFSPTPDRPFWIWFTGIALSSTVFLLIVMRLLWNRMCVYREGA